LIPALEGTLLHTRLPLTYTIDDTNYVLCSQFLRHGTTKQTY